MSELELLRSARTAHEEGLIDSADYDVVKVAFLRAQQIKAGLDAGFILPDDYSRARDAYLNALDFAGGAGAPRDNGAAPCGPAGTSSDGAAGGGCAPAAAAAAAPTPSRQRIPSSAPGSSVPATAAPAAGQRLSGSGGSGDSGGVAAGRAFGSGGSGARQAGAAAAAAAAAADTAALMADVPQYSKGTTAGKVSMAGIGLTEDCVNLFLHMKTRSAYKWITFKVDDSGKLVVPDRVGGKNSPYEEFVAALPPSECRYGVYDYEYISPERGSFNKIVFINWAPESAHIKTKMMYAATKDFFKGFLDGTGAELQANESGEVSEEEMRARVVYNLTRK